MRDKDKGISGEDLRVLRTAKKLSISEMSQRIGWSRQAISDWENEIGKPRSDALFHFLSVCGVLNVKAVIDEVTDLVQDYKRQKIGHNQRFYNRKTPVTTASVNASSDVEKNTVSTKNQTKTIESPKQKVSP